MARNSVALFATSTDLSLVLGCVQSEASIRYVVAGTCDRDAVRILGSIPELLGYQDSHQQQFLATEDTGQIVTRPIRLRTGELRYAIDQLANPRTVALRPGGIVREGVILAGDIGTASDDPHSQQLFSRFARAVRREFAKVKSYWVGPEALRLLDSGWRLTSGLRSPPEYDLSR
jgi:hypothetical protein